MQFFQKFNQIKTSFEKTLIFKKPNFVNFILIY